MTERKRVTDPSSPERNPHWDRPITREEYEEIPELDDSSLAPVGIGPDNTVVRRGRPRSPAPKELVTLRLRPDVLEHFRARGPGWRQRIEDILNAVVSVERDAAERNAAKSGKADEGGP
jgi:uncharacterized protein (DUF4415 family)